MRSSESLSEPGYPVRTVMIVVVAIAIGLLGSWALSRLADRSRIVSILPPPPSGPIALGAAPPTSRPAVSTAAAPTPMPRRTSPQPASSQRPAAGRPSMTSRPRRVAPASGVGATGRTGGEVDLHVVQVAVVQTREEAVALGDALRRAGLISYFVRYGSGFAVRLGAFRNPAGAEAVASQARSRGYPATILTERHRISP